MSKSPKQDIDFVPIWLQLKPAFYFKLKALAEESQLTMVEVLQRALGAFEKELRRKKTSAQDSKKEPEANTPQTLVEYRWSAVPKEERSRIARELAQKRWAKQKSREE